MDGTDSFDGPPPALLQAFLDEYERLVGYFSARIARREEAKDLVHDVYLNLRQIPLDRVIEKTRPYLWMVAKNELCHFLERSGRMKIQDVDDPALEAQLSEMPADDTTIDDEVSVALMREKFALLSPKCRAVMELKWNHELRYQEIAAALGISVDTVKKHLKTGMKLLRQHMQRLD